MPAKKPSAKATKAKKTVSSRPVKKAAAKSPARAARKTPAKSAGPAKAARKAKVTKVAKVAKVAKAARPAKTASRSASTRTSPAVARKTTKPAPAPARPAIVAPAPAQALRPLPAPVTSGSLLAGPRNVEPYVPRKGEEYMSKEQLEHFRAILSDWKQDLMQEVDRTMLHMKDEAANFPDPNDRATQESEFSLELRTRDRERKLIRKIDEALKRIEDGSYGFCMETGEPIGVKRLEARPVATLSVEAQERRERREKQFGDRDDWYR
jgi:DnaK suppressor protein